MEAVTFRECVCVGKELFFWEATTITPMVIDLEQQKCSILEITNKNDFRGEPFDLITAIDRKIFAVERSGAYMCEYSLDTQRVRYIKIDCCWRADENFALMQSEENCVFIFDRKHGITIYDTDSDEVKKIAYLTSVEEIITGCKFQGKYYLFPKDGDQALRFDMKRNEWDCIKLKAPLVNVVQAISDQDSIYLLTETGKIVEWNLENSWKVIDEAERFYSAERAASRLCLTKESFVVLPSIASNILVMDKKNLKTQIYKDYPKDFKYSNNTWTKYAGFCETEENYFFACRTSHYVLKISKKNAKFTWIPSEMNEKKFFDYEQKFSVVIEKPHYLDLFIGKVCEH